MKMMMMSNTGNSDAGDVDEGHKKSKFESMLVLYIMDITMLMKVDLNQNFVLLKYLI